MLDKADYIKEQYFLEVSSPGVERILRKDEHLEQNIKKEIEIKLFQPVNKSKVLQGILIKYDKDYVCIRIDDIDQMIERKNIAQIKTKYNW